MSCILIHGPGATSGECLSQLAGEKEDIVTCRDRESLVSALAGRRPDVLVYVLNEPVEDLGLLTQLRRAAPTLPIILLGDPTDLASRRTFQELKPTYFGVLPLEGSELSDVVHGALHHRSAQA